jgi:hypothetical protein
MEFGTGVAARILSDREFSGRGELRLKSRDLTLQRRGVLGSALDPGPLSLLDQFLELELEAHGVISGGKVSHALVLPRRIHFPTHPPLGVIAGTRTRGRLPTG